MAVILEYRSSGGRHLDFEVDRLPYVIGSSPESDLQLRHPEVRPRHTTLVRWGTSLAVVSSDADGAADVLRGSAVLLYDGGELFVGPYRLVVRLDEGDLEAPAAFAQPASTSPDAPAPGKVDPGREAALPRRGGWWQQTEHAAIEARRARLQAAWRRWTRPLVAHAVRLGAGLSTSLRLRSALVYPVALIACVGGWYTGEALNASEIDPFLEQAGRAVRDERWQDASVLLSAAAASPQGEALRRVVRVRLEEAQRLETLKGLIERDPVQAYRQYLEIAPEAPVFSDARELMSGQAVAMAASFRLHATAEAARGNHAEAKRALETAWRLDPFAPLPALDPPPAPVPVPGEPAVTSSGAVRPDRIRREVARYLEGDAAALRALEKLASSRDDAVQSRRAREQVARLRQIDAGLSCAQSQLRAGRSEAAARCALEAARTAETLARTWKVRGSRVQKQSLELLRESGNVAFASGSYEEAMRTWLEGARLAPGDPAITRALKKLDEDVAGERFRKAYQRSASAVGPQQQAEVIRQLEAAIAVAPPGPGFTYRARALQLLNELKGRGGS